MMNTVLTPQSLRSASIFCIILLFLLCGTPACAQTPGTAPEPAVYLNFDEGSGNSALDSSVHGNSATLYNTSRIETAGCSRALVF